MGNIHSILSTINYLGFSNVKVSANGDDVIKSDKLILPGVGNFNLAMKIIKEKKLDSYLQESVLEKKIPILGICLGHQAIAEYLGAKLNNMSSVYHGVKNKINILSNEEIFEGIPQEIEVGRYHSWEVVREGLPENISVTAEDENGTIMALSDASQKLYGIQFHPESVMTEYGEEMIQNFLKIAQS